MAKAVKWLVCMGAALLGSAIGDILYAQRGDHPAGSVVVALTPRQAGYCFIVVALTAQRTKGNLLAMLGGGLLAGLITSLASGAAKQGK